MLAALLLTKLIATYWQHALLWEAAVNACYKIRVHVFERVLQRELGFFEGGSGLSTGDIAYRITAEAADVADTLYALLNVSNLFARMDARECVCFWIFERGRIVLGTSLCSQ